MADENKSWSLANLRLPREELIEAVNGANSVPAACKAMLVEKISAFDSKARFLRLDAHCVVVKTGAKNNGAIVDTLHVTLTEV